ncbi:MAG: hypothetical protein IKJ27_03240 [Clostridia bacterium]|nr:hypothetical protein [Clostridia bacterium]
MVSEKIKEIIDKDLKLCKIFLEEDVEIDESYKEFLDQRFFEDEYGILHMFAGINSRYSSLIKDFPKDLDFEGKNGAISDEEFICYLRNVYEKLNMYKELGYKEKTNDNAPVINNKIFNNNTNTNTVINKTTSILEVKDKIESMTSLSDNQINEMLVKINQFEEILKKDERKNTKWEKIKDIVKWFADKGFDVVKTVIPVMLETFDKS